MIEQELWATDPELCASFRALIPRRRPPVHMAERPGNRRGSRWFALLAVVLITAAILTLLAVAG